MFEVINDPRLAGKTIRYHTWPYLRPQTVGEHSWQIARILLTIAPEQPRLLQHAIVHDMGEIAVGDIPYPVKRNNPDLAAVMNRLEDEALQKLENTFNTSYRVELSQEEKWIVKLAELIEMFEHGREEQILGNGFMEKVAERCYDAAADMIAVVISVNDQKCPRYAAATRAQKYLSIREELWG